MQRAIIPFAVICMLGSMLLPLPPFLIDILLIANLVSALILLLATFFISEPLKLSAFPSILLLMALARLSLNISTTRLILSRGEAGQAIKAFGEVVIAGDLIVGVVTFAIITLVQFLVVAKGAERVAEVSARFALDSLPGKQMSIDADMRTGLLSLEEAKARRQELQSESRLYGALDGAMKFVKGDAIAGILIIFINILGGITSGVGVKGLSFADAVDHYLLLSVGDGLLAQIPALLSSLAAGIIVTRVVDGKDSSLALELPQQLGALSFAAPVAAITALLLSLLLGPAALVCMVFPLGLMLKKFLRGRAKIQAERVAPKPFRAYVRENPAVVGVRLPKAVVEQSLDQIREAFEAVRHQLWVTTGLLFELPVVTASSDDSQVVAVLLHGEVVWEEAWMGGEFVDGDGGATFEEGTPVLHDNHTYLQITKCLSRVLGSVLPDLVTDRVMRHFLENCERQGSELATAIVPSVVTIAQLTELVRSLLVEKVSLKSARVFLHAVADAAPRCGVGRVLLEEVRIALRRSIVSGIVKPGEQIRCRALAPAVDFTIAKSERGMSGEDGELLMALVEVAYEWQDSLPLVVGRGSRRRVRESLLLRKIQIPVLSYEEVADCEICIVEVVSLTPVPLPVDLSNCLAGVSGSSQLQ